MPSSCRDRASWSGVECGECAVVRRRLVRPRWLWVLYGSTCAVHRVHLAVFSRVGVSAVSPICLDVDTIMGRRRACGQDVCVTRERLELGSGMHALRPR